MNVFLLLLCILQFILIIVLIYYNIKHGKIILKMEDAVENALDVIDQAYRRTSDILQIPVAMNTPEVREVLLHVKSIKSSVHAVAEIIAAPLHGVEEDNVAIGKDEKES